MARKNQGRLPDVMMDILKLTTKQNILTVSLNRPEKRNAFFPEMIRDLTKTFNKAAKDKTLRAIELTGEGASFCSGGDLEWMKSMADYSLKKNLKDAEALFSMYWAIRSVPVPVVGRVYGHAFGGGAGLTAVCDICAAETKTQFSFSEVKWGLVPAVISPFVLTKIQPGKASEWFLTAKIFTAPEALQGGLIQFAGAREEVDFYVEETLKAVLNSAPEAVRATKKLIQSSQSMAWTKIRPQVTKLIATRRVSEEGQRGLKAFLEKTSPRWNEELDGPQT